MNFLLRHSHSSSDLPSDAERDKRESLSPFQSSSPFFAAGIDDLQGDGKGGDFGRMSTVVPVEEHLDVSSNEGAILVPCRTLPDDWSSSLNAHSLSNLDRDFLFHGEQLQILVHLSSHDLSVPEIITPFKVAAVINRSCVVQTKASFVPDGGNGRSDGNDIKEDNSLDGSVKDHSDASNEMLYSETLNEEGHKRRSAQLLEKFQRSHFYVRIAGVDEALWKPRNGGSDGTSEVKDARTKAVVMEGHEFYPGSAGGIARGVLATCSLQNGDIVVVLQITVATEDVMDDAILEVLQFERSNSEGRNIHGPSDGTGTDSFQGLLHWLLPLDLPASPPISAVSSFSSSSSIVTSSPQKLGFGSSTNSSLFSFGHLRTTSQGSIPQISSAPVTSSGVMQYPPSPLSYAPDEWERLYPGKDMRGQDPGSEGLLSFRGIPLEPQRFSSRCGLEGLYIPGKRWRRKISVLQPVAIETYFADCNTADLICVLVENILPSRLKDVVIYVDSVSIICQSTGAGMPPQPIPIFCVEVGENHTLPGLPLRPGEQHSFILRPMNPSHSRQQNILQEQVSQAMPKNSGNSTKKAPDDELMENMQSGEYAVIISCRCSHTESKLHFKHSLDWRPRPQRDLRLSLTVEDSGSTLIPAEGVPQLKTQVVTVQATNLTSKDLDLVLLAPSFMPVSSPSAIPFAKPRVGISQSFDKILEKSTAPPKFRSLSLPLRKTDDMTMSTKVAEEKGALGGDVVADCSSARTHLWLQSTVPFGCVPSQSTTVVKCDLLPLVDGIITLDALHVATKDRGHLYIPENPLQIHCTCGITSNLD